MNLKLSQLYIYIMNSEERKEYNKNYYSIHKVELLKQFSKSIECVYCKRNVANSRLKSHQKTPLCIRNRIGYISILDVEKEVDKRLNEILNKQEVPILCQPSTPICPPSTPITNIQKCGCGSHYVIKNNGQYYHEKTNKHINWVENQNKNIE